MAEKERFPRSMPISLLPRSQRRTIAGTLKFNILYLWDESAAVLMWCKGGYRSCGLCKGYSLVLKPQDLYMWGGALTEMPGPFEVTCTELVAESQTSHSRDMVASFLMINSPPSPTPPACLRAGELLLWQDLQGPWLGWKQSYFLEHILDYLWAWTCRASSRAALHPLEGKRAWDAVTSHTLGSRYRMT